MIINQNSQPEELKRSNKIWKIINDGINLNLRETNRLIKKYGNNSKNKQNKLYKKYNIKIIIIFKLYRIKKYWCFI